MTNEPPKETVNIVVTGLSYSFLMTFLAELGDKTFIMIMIYVPKMNNMILFISSSLSLAMMHTLGSLFGGLFQLFIAQNVLTIISCTAFFLFGILLIYQGKTM
jgi:putative Ca2+/H+ antiporter (TMEM165/GDT1 family)